VHPGMTVGVYLTLSSPYFDTVKISLDAPPSKA
jgi:hypothetical protein